ncbi:Peptidyl-Asp metalloendopeptidase [Seminavis robusta]|uniref:Peptidyl-Asp metalloendopeptidase n=1 Tax=Seminavis robusta TaxID=568900 RepID=A0A9N8E6C6_9STRA|nr:Peptidyl-Asp metalloendopeptidase [Seminavis robusta]|eukprot:Sro561_g166870.1 Peptidyl-Asp metalloendopeptidase (756) ;mRNA; r:50107-52374
MRRSSSAGKIASVSVVVFGFACFALVSSSQEPLHIAPAVEDETDHFFLEAPPSGNSQDNSYLIDIAGLGHGRDFYVSESLTIQLEDGGPVWKFHSQQPDILSRSVRPSFVGSTLDGTVTCNLLRHASSSNSEDDILTGVVQDLARGLWYEIKPNADGFNTVTVVRDEDVPESVDPTAALTFQESPDEYDDTSEGDATSFLQRQWNRIPSAVQKSIVNGGENQAAASANTIIDVLVVWTMNAECVKSSLAAGCAVSDDTQAKMQAAVTLMMSETNRVYENSNLDLTLRLAHAQRDTTGFQESGFARALLFASTSRTIKQLRYDHQADIVLFLIDNAKAPRVAGMSYNNFMTPAKRGWLFSVLAAQSTALRYVPAHEIGHLFGCFHDRGTLNACNANTTNWGHRDADGRYATVMAYRCTLNQCDGLAAANPCPRIPYFSGNVEYNGEFLGGSFNNCRDQIMATKDLVAAVMPRDDGVGSGALLLDCFSPLNEVQVLGKGTVFMPDVQIGDRVLTASGSYETVYTIDHYHPFRPTEYLQLKASFSSLNTTRLLRQQDLFVELSPFHMIFLQDSAYPVPANEVRIGDLLQTTQGPAQVAHITSVVSEGLYNLLTTSGTIVVSGIVASTYSVPPFTTRKTAANHLEIAGWKLLHFQTLIHLLLAPLRVVSVPLLRWQLRNNPDSHFCREERKPKIHWYSKIGLSMANWWAKQSALLQGMGLGVVLVVCGVFNCVPWILSALLVASTCDVLARSQYKGDTQ